MMSINVLNIDYEETKERPFVFEYEGRKFYFQNYDDMWIALDLINSYEKSPSYITSEEKIEYKNFIEKEIESFIAKN